MHRWGHVLVLGLGNSSKRVVDYLKNARLDYLQRPLDSQSDLNDPLLAFVCTTTSNLHEALASIQWLEESFVPFVLVGPQRVAELLDNDKLDKFVGLPAEDSILNAAFNQTLYGPEANLHSLAMRDYAQRLRSLTSRERLIAQMAANGETNRRIARVVCLAEKSVERERRKVRQKVEAKNSADLLRIVTLGSMFEFCGGANQPFFCGVSPSNSRAS